MTQQIFTPASLPISPDALSLDLLRRAYLLLTHAESHISDQSGIGGAIVLIGVDTAIEALLRAAIQHLDIGNELGKTFSNSDMNEVLVNLNGKLKASSGKDLPYRSDILWIRNIRNQAQHGFQTSQPDLTKAATIGRRFFDKVIPLICGLNPNQLHVGRLIIDPQIQRLALDAEEALDRCEFVEAIIRARDVFEHSRLSAFPEIAGVRSELVVSRLGKGFLDQTMDEVYFSNVGAAVENYVLGVDPVEHVRFKDLLTHIPFDRQAKNDSFMFTSGKEPSENEARWCVDYAERFAIRLEGRRSPARSDYDGYWEYSYGSVDFRDHEKAPLMRHGTPHSASFHLVDRRTNESLNQLTGRTVRLHRRHFENDQQRFESQQLVLVDRVASSLIVNEPELWSAVVEVQAIPYTWQRSALAGQVLTLDSVDLSVSSSGDISRHLGNDVAAELVLAARGTEGFSDPSAIESLSLVDDQLNKLRYWTRLSGTYADTLMRGTPPPELPPDSP